MRLLLGLLLEIVVLGLEFSLESREGEVLTPLWPGCLRTPLGLTDQKVSCSVHKGVNHVEGCNHFNTSNFQQSIIYTGTSGFLVCDDCVFRTFPVE